jgi:HEPN domain-containing protein
MVEMEDALTQGEETQPSAAVQAMMQFCSANSDATTLLHTAGHDYAAARCLLLNGLVSSGLVMGAQAIEKFLKAYILLKNPAKAVRQSQHSLTDLLKEADQLAPSLGLSKYSAAMSRHEDYYRNRYPDNKGSVARNVFHGNNRAGRVHHIFERELADAPGSEIPNRPLWSYHVLFARPRCSALGNLD